MLPRVCAPAQPLEVEVPRVAEEVPQLGEEAIGYMAQPKDSDVLTPALRAAGTHGVFGIGLCRFTQAMTPCSSLNEWLSLIHSLTMASTGRHRTLHELYCWPRFKMSAYDFSTTRSLCFRCNNGRSGPIFWKNLYDQHAKR
jgi:hypothetical protein